MRWTRLRTCLPVFGLLGKKRWNTYDCVGAYEPLYIYCSVCRYRGLKSFRTSPWDAKENLPSDYARIFQFENFNRFRKHVLREELSDGIVVCVPLVVCCNAVMPPIRGLCMCICYSLAVISLWS